MKFTRNKLALRMYVVSQIDSGKVGARLWLWRITGGARFTCAEHAGYDDTVFRRVKRRVGVVDPGHDAGSGTTKVSRQKDQVVFWCIERTNLVIAEMSFLQ